MTISLRFTDFWLNSSLIKDNFFIPLIENVYQTQVCVEKNPNKMVDLEIFSVFSHRKSIMNRVLTRVSNSVREETNLIDRKIVSKSKKRIWYSGENKRAPFGDQFDSYLGYDPDGLLPNCHYLPLWVMNFDHFGNGSAHGFSSAHSTQENLLKPRVYQNSGEREFCCAFISNPMSFRIGILKQLGTIEQLTLFGRSFKNEVEDKYSVSKNFKFSFSFENNLYPGYVTEKLLEGYLGGSIPLYWGIDTSKYFNPKAFINFLDFPSVEEFLSCVQECSSNSNSYRNIFEQPLLLRKFEIAELVNKLRKDLF